jgi:hypothetical protein
MSELQNISTTRKQFYNMIMFSSFPPDHHVHVLSDLQTTIATTTDHTASRVQMSVT